MGGVKDMETSGNTYFFMRHGESESNVGNFISSTVENSTRLTENGKEQVKARLSELAQENIDIIFASAFNRTKETAEMVADAIGISRDKIIFDPRIQEIGTGKFDGKNVSEYHEFFSSFMERFVKGPEGGESIRDVKRRAMEFLFDIEKRYKGKKILIITHEYVVWMSDAGSRGMSDEEAYEMKKSDSEYAATASVTRIPFVPFPHSPDFEIDMHRPYVDDVSFECGCGGEMKRVPEVFDCWFESGSMPYAQFHYPFENQEEFHRNFPAEFIAEAVDQTRGWFYNMHALSIGLFLRPAFENAIATGLILAEDGQKMSKKLKNYPDPMDLVGKYGADSLRIYLLSSPLVHAEDLNFSEKGVDEIFKKIIVRLQNVLSFYELYRANDSASDFPKSSHILDQWIFARLGALNSEVTHAMREYRLSAALRPIAAFIDDLSTWYLQNSRERLKGKEDDENGMEMARETLRYVLFEFSKILAPFAPFAAEDVYQKTKRGEIESVHLERWPAEDEEKSDAIISLMEETRKIVSLGLLARAKGAIKVRQPLRKITLKESAKKQFDMPAGKEFLKLIADRVNVKDVVFGSIAEDAVLDFEITEELKEEGTLREIIRTAQELRKKENLNPADTDRTLLVETDGAGKRFLKKWEKDIKKATLFAHVLHDDVSGGEVLEIDDFVFTFAIK
jgi:isoleucyl-tRNA synthetase